MYKDSLGRSEFRFILGKAMRFHYSGGTADFSFETGLMSQAAVDEKDRPR